MAVKQCQLPGGYEEITATTGELEKVGIIKATCGDPFQAWEMWLSPHSEKPVGSEVGGQDPHPWIGSPVENQACIVPRML